MSAGCSGPGGLEVLSSSARRRLLKFCKKNLEPHVTHGPWGTECTVREAKGFRGPAGRQDAHQVWKLMRTTSSSGPPSESALRSLSAPRGHSHGSWGRWQGLPLSLPCAAPLMAACWEDGAWPPVLMERGVTMPGGGAGVGEVLAGKSCRPAPGRSEGWLFQSSSWEGKASCVTGQPCWSPVGFFPFSGSAVPKLAFQTALPWEGSGRDHNLKSGTLGLTISLQTAKVERAGPQIVGEQYSEGFGKPCWGCKNCHVPPLFHSGENPSF